MISRSEAEIMKNWKGDLSTPVVSVCCITYNHENFIEEALESFLMQETDFPFEIVIDDDASSDRTPLILQEYKKRYPKIINLNIRKKNVGSVENFFGNIKRARADFVAVCEGDDFWRDKKKLQIQTALMQKYNLGFSFHAYFEKDGDEYRLIERYRETTIVPPEEMIKNGGEFSATSSMMIRKRCIDRIENYLDIPNLEVGDIYLQIVCSMNGALYINRPMSVYRIGGHWSRETNDDVEKKIRHYEKNTFHLTKLSNEKDFSGMQEAFASLVKRNRIHVMTNENIGWKQKVKAYRSIVNEIDLFDKVRYLLLIHPVSYKFYKGFAGGLKKLLSHQNSSLQEEKK